MQYWGKILGVFMGIIVGGGYVGALFGLIIGHIYDSKRNRARHGIFANQQTRQTLFFRTSFQVMGHLTKSKGRVTKADIQVASQLMDRMQLHGEARISAQAAFREGKQADFPLRNKLRELKVVCFGRFDLVRMFLEVQIQAAFADGELHPNERQVLYVIAEELGISRVQFEQFLSMMEGGRQFGDQSSGDYQYSQRGPTIADACKVLGVSESNDATTIKRAYRRLMAEHHPDKLVAKGLPAEMMEMAKQKAQEIQAAYDLIKREKGFK